MADERLAAPIAEGRCTACWGNVPEPECEGGEVTGIECGLCGSRLAGREAAIEAKEGAEQVLHFNLYDGGQHKYSIFHASRHSRASNEMKAAIRKVDRRGSFSFRGGQTEQLTLGVEKEFQDKGWVTVGEVEEFVMSDRTDYHKSQLRSNARAPPSSGLPRNRKAPRETTT